MSKLIDGKVISAKVEQEVAEKVAKLNKKPNLAVILAGDNKASKIYVKKKKEACERVKIGYVLIELPETVSNEEILTIIQKFNENEAITGILVQLPLPKQIDVFAVFKAIDPFKDVDVFNPENVGLLVQNRPRFIPATPFAIQRMLQETNLSVEGKKVCIINRSNIVGKPLSSMLIQDNAEYANATVTVCHDKTPKETLKFFCQNSDFIVVAVGIPEFLTPDLVNENHVILDVGINRCNGKIIGDAHSEVKNIVNWITPVPGGIGMVTVAMLLYNVYKAAVLSR